MCVCARSLVWPLLTVEDAESNTYLGQETHPKQSQKLICMHTDVTCSFYDAIRSEFFPAS